MGDGATANVTVGVGGDVTAATIVSGGSGYTDGERLNFDTSNADGIGGSSSDAFIRLNYLVFLLQLVIMFRLLVLVQ